MSAFIGLAALKEAVGITGEAADSIDDSILTSVIWRASAIVDNHLAAIRPGWVGIAAGSNSRASIGSNTRTYDGTGDDWLWIDDASSVSAVVVDDSTVASTAYTTWPYNENPKRALVYVLPTTSAYGLRASVWSIGTANVEVTGYFGLATIPDDIAQVTLMVAILLWRRYQAGDPAPTVNLATRQNDPELAGILESLYPRWGQPWVKGA